MSEGIYYPYSSISYDILFNKKFNYPLVEKGVKPVELLSFPACKYELSFLEDAFVFAGRQNDFDVGEARLFEEQWLPRFSGSVVLKRSAFVKGECRFSRDSCYKAVFYEAQCPLESLLFADDEVIRTGVDLLLKKYWGVFPKDLTRIEERLSFGVMKHVDKKNPLFSYKNFKKKFFPFFVFENFKKNFNLEEYFQFKGIRGVLDKFVAGEGDFFNNMCVLMDYFKNVKI